MTIIFNTISLLSHNEEQKYFNEYVLRKEKNENQ